MASGSWGFNFWRNMLTDIEAQRILVTLGHTNSGISGNWQVAEEWGEQLDKLTGWEIPTAIYENVLTTLEEIEALNVEIRTAARDAGVKKLDKMELDGRALLNALKAERQALLSNLARLTGVESKLPTGGYRVTAYIAHG
jgi:hypothetical protein